ncbi:MAG: MBL fold metallo-hydrolase [Clostridia bacterium]|nr:MBL fold metallo-hydrolase [Clostridia bacterium]
MLLKSFKGRVGALGSYTNTYLVYDEKTFDGALIDLANNLEGIQEFVESINIKIKYLILTHCHADHIAGLNNVKKLFPDIKILIHEKDADGLVSDNINLSSFLEAEPNFIEADLLLKDGDIIPLGDLQLKIIHTPGHTAGSISILIDDALFSGDTLFKGCYGRTDMPTGNGADMLKSIDKLLKLPGNTLVYPGHNQTTIIEEERN